MSDQPTDQPTDRPTLEHPGATAMRLGISRNAVLQRIKRGTLLGEKVDGIWWVVRGDQPTDQPYNRATDRPSGPTPRMDIEASARSQLEAIRDEWLAPLVAQITEQAEALGRLEAERDQARQSAETAIAARDQLQEERDDLIAVREALHARLSALEAQQAEPPTRASSAPQTATDAATGGPWWMFWKR